MFAFFKRGKSAGKHDERPNAAERSRTLPNGGNTAQAPVAGAPSPNEYDVTNDRTPTRKDVVNLLLPDTDYDKRTGVGALWDIMAGKKRKKNKKNISRAESCRELTPQRDPNSGLQRSQSHLTRSAEDVTAPTPPDKNTPQTRVDAAQYVKQLVLQKYANKTPESRKQHVSLVYVPDEREREKEREAEKRRAETLLREIARSIDCTVDLINENQMGANDSKDESGRADRNLNELVNESVKGRDESIKAFKRDLEGELEKLIKKKTDKEESDPTKKKSNLKPPKSDTEGCSDDDRSESGKKKVTFTKHIQFDDGDQQTDEEVDSSFESISSEEEELEIPDNDELLGGVVVARNEDIQTENRKEPPSTIQQCESNEAKVEEVELKRISSDNSDSGFIEISEKQNSEEPSYNKTSGVSDSESEVSDSETEEEDVTIEEEEDEHGIDQRAFEPHKKDGVDLTDSETGTRVGNECEDGIRVEHVTVMEIENKTGIEIYIDRYNRREKTNSKSMMAELRSLPVRASHPPERAK
ncbi:hypothetical protein EVAR_43911_1 [Eumeta japonica]|uniref:Uncharacterized protein n=1 Tax=Eumeta variegata TaxID=151549 RepID=A0A4C1WPC9_EUMVA|nr:hypothetical protein EVAR_43911_1 [Eumeta japonica]